MIPPKALERIEKCLAKLERWRYAPVAAAPLEMADTMEHFRMPPEYLKFEPAPVGCAWGRHWGTTWFRGQIEVPRACKGRRVYYRHASFSDKLLWVDGHPFCGMNPRHCEALLLKYARGGETFQIYVEAYAGHPIPGMDPYFPEMYTHQFCEADPGRTPPLVLEASELVAEREQTAGLYYDASVLFRTAKSLDGNSMRRALLLDTLNRAIDLVPIHWQTEEELEVTCREARKLLAPLLALKNAPTTPTAGLAGHCHIDIGWLWPVRESIRKAAKSFSTVLSLMDDYAEFRFQQSQPVLYDMMEREYPEIVARIKKRVKEGRWEPNGGMWVEADCNVTGGESLVRQFLEGRKKTMELFGYKADTLWLPDVFGYSAALPQILKKCDIENFVTSKINWNDTNRFPFDTFWWEGIDGTVIFTQFITTTAPYSGYNAEVFPDMVRSSWNQVQQKEAQDSVLCSVGWGDGGGGPSREMCEHAARMKDVEGCIKTEWVNVSAFLKRLREQAVERPRWVGELYLEYHRGTYTAQSRIKRGNRRVEGLLRETELFCALAMTRGQAYPAEALQRLWRALLTNQFHDILPGTSIRAVVETAEAEYAQMEAELLDMRAAAFTTLGAAFLPDTEGAAWLAANSLSWQRAGIVHLPGTDCNAAIDAEGAPLLCQTVDGGLAVRVSVPSLAVIPIALRKKENGAQPSPFAYSGKSLETPHYRAAFDKAGRITSLFDKSADRELVREGGRLNELVTAEHLPVNWDAWDIDRYYRGKIQVEDRLLAREIVADGPLFLTLRSEYSIGRHSKLIQEMTFYAHQRRIDFRTQVEWHEKQALLKARFALDVHTAALRCGIQFGHALRNTHANTSWDAAQFEICAHKWVDLSEGGYGAALLNDCKYGHDTLDGMLGLTLLKSSLCPDEIADQGRHEFTYALLPHPGPFSVESVVREAYSLDAPLTAAKLGTTTGTESAVELCAVSNPNVIVEAVKKAESDDAIVLRLYEAGNTRGPVNLTFCRPIRKAVECNLLEERETAARYRNEELALSILPFEIKTVKVYFR